MGDGHGDDGVAQRGEGGVGRGERREAAGLEVGDQGGVLVGLEVIDLLFVGNTLLHKGEATHLFVLLDQK